MKIRTSHSLLLALLAVLPSIAIAQVQSSASYGGLAGAPMRMGFGSRGIAMGNAMTAVLSGDLQSYYNPALTTFESAPTAAASYGVLSLDRRLNYLSYTQRLEPKAGISFSIINAGVGNIDGRDADGNHTQTLSTSENSFIFSFGLHPDPRLSIGVSAKILYYSLYQSLSSTTVAFDLGALYRLTPTVTLGAVIQDINARYKWDSSPLYGTEGNAFFDRYPLRKRLGVSWDPGVLPVILSGEIEYIGSEPLLRFGTEVAVVDGLSLRGGVDRISLKSDFPDAPSLGFSAEQPMRGWTPSFQYAYVFEPSSPSGIHILTLSVRFE